MGSSNTKPGTSANPRVVYSDKFAQRIKRDVRIDAPVLVDIDHGSVRYRYCRHGDSTTLRSRREQPHDGETAEIKRDYFYHTRMRHKPGSSSLRDFQRLCVTHVPNNARNKKLFYVYGIGMEAQNGRTCKPSDDGLQRIEDYSWPEKRTIITYDYDLVFSEDCGDSLQAIINTPRVQSDILTDVNTDTHPDMQTKAANDEVTNLHEVDGDRNSMRVTMADKDKIGDIKRIVAVRIHKSVTTVHLWYNGQDLGCDEVIGELHRNDVIKEASQPITVVLKLKDV